MKKNNNVLIVVLILMLLGTCSYIIYDKVFYKEKETTKVETKNEKKEVKEEKLDVNSRLVKTLYNKVVSNNSGYHKYWMYDKYLSSNNTTDYIVAKSDSETKMNLVGNYLNSNKSLILDCNNSSIPNTIKINDYDYMSACYAISKGASGYSPYSYEKSYIETVYKDLFGNNAVLDTSIDFRTGYYAMEMYHYVESLDRYVLYVTEGGGTSAGTYTSNITKANKIGDEIKIYEKVIFKGELDKTEEYNYVYTFKLDNDGMYSFVSRVKES